MLRLGGEQHLALALDVVLDHQGSLGALLVLLLAADRRETGLARVRLDQLCLLLRELPDAAGVGGAEGLDCDEAG